MRVMTGLALQSGTMGLNQKRADSCSSGSTAADHGKGPTHERCCAGQGGVTSYCAHRAVAPLHSRPKPQASAHYHTSWAALVLVDTALAAGPMLLGLGLRASDLRRFLPGDLAGARMGGTPAD